jgi:acyl carrier protein
MSPSLPRLQQIFEDLIGPCCPNIEESCRVTDLGLDSLDREELAMVIEEQFDIKLSTEDLSKLGGENVTVQDWLDYLDKRI